MVHLSGVNPEDQIVILENFIPVEVSKALIQHFDAEKKNLTSHSDNELSLGSISPPHIRKLIFDITNRILQLMKLHYPLGNRTYVLDHGGLYARIPKNFCSYHTDNLYFDCPLHGRDQSRLRTICPGNCPGSKYVPNHTYWREYTALIYLNDEFTGGELAFEDGPNNKIYKKVIPIHANMLVLAPNGKNFYHEVYPIQTGKRYSLHFWFTSDPEIRRSWK
jgi:hypothetical protein